MRWILLVLFTYLQVEFWIGKSNLLDTWQLHQKLSEQTAENKRLQHRNQLLTADVLDLKQGTAAIEEYARSELGMIKKNEVFFLLVQ